MRSSPSWFREKMLENDKCIIIIHAIWKEEQSVVFQSHPLPWASSLAKWACDEEPAGIGKHAARFQWEAIEMSGRQGTNIRYKLYRHVILLIKQALNLVHYFHGAAKGTDVTPLTCHRNGRDTSHLSYPKSSYKATFRLVNEVSSLFYGQPCLNLIHWDQILGSSCVREQMQWGEHEHITKAWPREGLTFEADKMN
jgi:hypothetical protein